MPTQFESSRFLIRRQQALQIMVHACHSKVQFTLEWLTYVGAVIAPATGTRYWHARDEWISRERIVC